MNYLKYLNFDTANAPGVCVTLFVSGCTLNCKGCFNKDAQNFNAGHEFTAELQEQIIADMQHQDISAFCVLGGDPLMPKNFATVYSLCKLVREVTGKPIWLWSGHTLDFIQSSDYTTILNVIDVLVDGPFIEELADSTLRFRGSTNQTICRRGIHF